MYGRCWATFMSSAHFDVIERTEAYLGVHEWGEAWALKLFHIATDASMPCQVEEVRQTLSWMLDSITARMSAEFDYGRFGCVIYHEGRRGSCVTVMHYGNWGMTFEVFASGWYRFRRQGARFELLDDVQPAMCWFEMPRIMAEISAVRELARSGDLADVRRRYLALRPWAAEDARKAGSGAGECEVNGRGESGLQGSSL